MAAVALQPTAAAARPRCGVGPSLPLLDAPLPYRAALGALAWPEGAEPDVELLVPEWALRVCALSRHGRSPLLRAWLAWCAEAGEDAPRRALLIHNIARLMRPEEALRAIHQTIQGGP